MGVVIDSCKAGVAYGNHANAADDFATDENGRLVAHEGENFEYMPLGSLELVAFISVRDAYRENPYTAKEMRWEIGFSENRVSFYSPENNLLIGGVSDRPGQSTLGFHYYNELRSLSLGSAREQDGPYVSMAFVIQATSHTQLPVGIRVHGDAANLNIFATMLAARLSESYANMSSVMGLDIRELDTFFSVVTNFDYHAGNQTDLFITAVENTLQVTQQRPLGS